MGTPGRALLGSGHSDVTAVGHQLQGHAWSPPPCKLSPLHTPGGLWSRPIGLISVGDTAAGQEGTEGDTGSVSTASGLRSLQPLSHYQGYFYPSPGQPHWVIPGS